MLNVTLDTNCIIDLEQNRVPAPYLRELLQMHNNQGINLRVVAISASEQQPNKTSIAHLDEFRRRIALVGLGDVEILPTIAYVGLSFAGYCLVGGGTVTELERKIQEILFPTIELEYTEFCKKRKINPDNREAWHKWVNRKCDVLAMWSHIWHDGDIFVTRDQDFHKEDKKSRLVEIGAGKILRPAEAVEFLVNR